MTDMVQVPRDEIEWWHSILQPYVDANVRDPDPLRRIVDVVQEMEKALDLSTNAPDMDTSPEHVDDVDMFITRQEVAGMIELAVFDHETDAHGMHTGKEDSVNDPDCIEASPENVTGPHAMPPQIVSFTDNGDGTYHVIWSDRTEQNMTEAKPHGWARGMLDLRGSVDPREVMADKPVMYLGTCPECGRLMMFTSDAPDNVVQVGGPPSRRMQWRGDQAGKPVEAMADLRGTVDPVQVTYTTTHGIEVPRSMLCRWEAAIWAALYDGDNGPLVDARREMMAKIKEPTTVTATPHPWEQSWNWVIDPVVREA